MRTDCKMDVFLLDDGGGTNRIECWMIMIVSSTYFLGFEFTSFLR